MTAPMTSREELLAKAKDALFNIARIHGYKLNDAELGEAVRAVTRAIGWDGAPAQDVPNPFGYLIEKSGVNNGYYFITPGEFEHVEERFRSHLTPVYTLPSTGLPAPAPHAEVREGLTERLVTGVWDDARAQAIEECAKIADRWVKSKNLHEHLAATDIARLIRALPQQEVSGK